jgi:NAD/NADP transhydrogenase beta subunit
MQTTHIEETHVTPKSKLKVAGEDRELEIKKKNIDLGVRITSIIFWGSVVSFGFQIKLDMISYD